MPHLFEPSVESRQDGVARLYVTQRDAEAPPPTPSSTPAFWLDPQLVAQSNGKPATKGTCPLCGGSVFRIGG